MPQPLRKLASLHVPVLAKDRIFMEAVFRFEGETLLMTLSLFGREVTIVGVTFEELQKLGVPIRKEVSK
jgi:hypothetical protein